MPETIARSTPRRRSRFRLSNAVVHAVLLTGGIAMVAPMLYGIIVSLSTSTEAQNLPPVLWPEIAQWGNYAKVFAQLPFLKELAITIGVTLIRLAGQLVFCSIAGYALARMRFPGRGAVLALILSIIMVPTQIYFIPQYQIIQGLGLLNSVLGIALPGVFSAFGTFLMRQFFMSMPVELEEAARLDGANSFTIFWRIMLPLASNGLWALSIITVLWSWNDLLWPLIVTSGPDSSPLSVGITVLSSAGRVNNTPVLMAASLMALAPLVILFVALQRRVVAGLANTGLK
jgi:multiple sugar transport system permease protein